MNSDSESLQHYFLSWLLTDSGNPRDFKRIERKDTHGAENLLQVTTALASSYREAETKLQTFQLGEIPTVQERFQAVLKRRLQCQTESQPPLFPWETQITDYPEYLDEPAVVLVPTWGWAVQQSNLDLPILLPDSIFRQLLDKCQALITSSSLLGPKLIQAVENFFPNEFQTLNNLAGVVLTGATRSKKLKLPPLAGDYADLQLRQQMLLSLLAAKQLLESLTLYVSSTEPLTRQWLTSLGVLNLRVEYQLQGQVGKLWVQGDLPSKGSIKIQGNGSQIKAESSTPGCLSVELGGVQLNQTYTLTIELKEIDQQPLSFAIIPTS
ncbi:MAG: PatU [Chlorogloeopsis fritschii C42_A2020_084]|uniref:PatU n=1 Tax=Chlorogloeopsis fritschii TaxID=1124 RepID=UPI0019F21A7F|nr:PatU [Chlorogloeopsis fritschii]MBF2004160.1 PatU [Chlorogloeopsis fritschii C42_A2020_084]